jgi:hypothetical protein
VCCVVFSSLTKHNGSERKVFETEPASHHITSFSAFGEMFEVVSKHLRINEKQNFRRKLFSKFNEIETVVLRDLLYSISNLLICEANANYLFYDQFHSLAKKNIIIQYDLKHRTISSITIEGWRINQSPKNLM